MLTGEPLAITRDIAVPKEQRPDGAALSDRYIRLTDRLLNIEVDILDVLSGDS